MLRKRHALCRWWFQSPLCVLFPVPIVCVSLSTHCVCFPQYGEEAYKEGGPGAAGGGGGPADIFDLFGGGSRSRRERKGESVQHVLRISLEEAYKGITKYVQRVLWQC